MTQLSNRTLAEQMQQRILDYASEHGYTGESPAYQPFQVTLHLATPLAGYDPIHLDSLLQKAVVTDALQGRKLPESARPYRIPVPLETVWASSEGVPLYHSSSLLPIGPIKKGVFYWTKKNNARASQIAQRKKDGMTWQPDSGSGQFKEYLIGLPTTAARAIRGYGVGLLDEVRRLLTVDFFRSVGKKGTWEFGSVLSIEISAVAPVSRFAFVEEGHLLRPVPQAAFPALGLVTEASPAFLAYSPPYWLAANQAMCYPEGTPVECTEPAQAAPPAGFPTPRNLADFLWRCEKQEMFHIPGDLQLLHGKEQKIQPHTERCCFCGQLIPDAYAIARKHGISANMGNVADFLNAPESVWMCQPCAIVLCQPKKYHRNLVALLSPEGMDGRLLWPTIAPDVAHPTQARPLWREILVDLQDVYRGWQAVLIFKDESKSRIWPRARVGVVGEHTPFFFSDLSQSAMQENVFVACARLAAQMLLIESWLDMGYGKTALRTGTFNAPIEQVAAVRTIQQRLTDMWQTPEFLIALRIARTTEERTLRKGTTHAH